MAGENSGEQVTPETPSKGTPQEGVTTPPAGDAGQTGETPPKDEEKSGEQVKPEDQVPENYDLRIEEDGFLSQEDVERIAAEGKELGLTNEEAQAVLDMESAAIDRFMDRQQKTIDDAHADWLKAMEADKEIGGEDYEKNIELSRRVVDAFGSKELKELLTASKYFDHPELVRMFVKMGKAMGEDGLVRASGNPTSPKSMEETFYGGN